MEFVRQREAATTPFNRFYQPQPKAATTEKECTLVTINRSSKDDKWQPRKVTVEPEPSPEPKPVLKPRTWHEDVRVKELEAIKYRDAHLKQVLPNQSVCIIYMHHMDLSDI